MKLSELRTKLKEQGNQKFYCTTDKTYYYIQDLMDRDNIVIMELCHGAAISYDDIIRAIHMEMSIRGDCDVLFSIKDQLFRAL